MNVHSTKHQRRANPAQPGLLRSLNNRVVLDLLIERGTLNRADVREFTGLSKPTASQLLTRLEETGLVLPSGLGETGPGGRAPQMYRINPRAGFAAAVDVRPDLIDVRVCDIAGSVIAEHTHGVSAQAPGPADAASAVAAAVALAGLDIDDLDAIVLAVPGSYDRNADQLHHAEHLTGWQDAGLSAVLSGHFGAMALSIENDVNAVALAEHRARGSSDESFFLLWLGEGIGGALMLDGKPYRGSRGAAAEATFLLPPGARTENRDRAIGGFEDLVGVEVLRSMLRECGQGGPWPEAFGEVFSNTTRTETAKRIARGYALGLVSVIALIDPACIVLGGELASLGSEALRGAVTAELQDLLNTVPPVELARVEVAPILEGAMLLSLELAREHVFTT